MPKHTKSTIMILIAIILIFSSVFCVNAQTVEENKYYLGETVNTGKDTGYSKTNKITEKDPHFGWKLGEFFLSGYSDVELDENGNPVFLKNVGDQLTLWYCLEQDINKLNGNDNLTICEDKNGYDEYFEVPKTNFGKGTLIVRSKDSDNHWGEPTIYTDYLEANATEDAYTKVQIFEEGDYEVALNYEIKENKLSVFGWKPVNTFNNYRVYACFSIRNGNCMVYPFDVATGTELTNSSFTENGFYLDVANSKYLDINIKKEVLNETSSGLVEDIRFNKPTKDGEQFTEEGIYTITVNNEYTKQETVKKIYVGTNDVLKAHVTTGFAIDEINHQLSMGATISGNGELISAPTDNSTNDEISTEQSSSFENFYYVVLAGVILLVIVIFIMIISIHNKKKASISEY